MWFSLPTPPPSTRAPTSSRPDAATRSNATTACRASGTSSARSRTHSAACTGVGYPTGSSPAARSRRIRTGTGRAGKRSKSSCRSRACCRTRIPGAARPSSSSTRHTCCWRSGWAARRVRATMAITRIDRTSTGTPASGDTGRIGGPTNRIRSANAWRVSCASHPPATGSAGATSPARTLPVAGPAKGDPSPCGVAARPSSSRCSDFVPTNSGASGESSTAPCSLKAPEARSVRSARSRPASIRTSRWPTRAGRRVTSTPTGARAAGVWSCQQELATASSAS